jgi:hypothetical protein
MSASVTKLVRKWSITWWTAPVISYVVRLLGFAKILARLLFLFVALAAVLGAGEEGLGRGQFDTSMVHPS